MEEPTALANKMAFAPTGNPLIPTLQGKKIKYWKGENMLSAIRISYICRVKDFLLSIKQGSMKQHMNKKRMETA